MVLADKFISEGKVAIKNSHLFIAAIIGTALYGILAFSSDIFKTFNDIPSMVGYISIALILCQIPIVKKIFAKMSTYSYELYLIHILIFTGTSIK